MVQFIPECDTQTMLVLLLQNPLPLLHISCCDLLDSLHKLGQHERQVAVTAVPQVPSQREC